MLSFVPYIRMPMLSIVGLGFWDRRLWKDPEGPYRLRPGKSLASADQLLAVANFLFKLRSRIYSKYVRVMSNWSNANSRGIFYLVIVHMLQYRYVTLCTHLCMPNMCLAWPRNVGIWHICREWLDKIVYAEREDKKLLKDNFKAVTNKISFDHIYNSSSKSIFK